MFKTHFLSKTYQSKVIKRMGLPELFGCCGGGGIRTHACLRTIDFQSIGMVHYPTPPNSFCIILGLCLSGNSHPSSRSTRPLAVSPMTVSTWMAIPPKSTPVVATNSTLSPTIQTFRPSCATTTGATGRAISATPPSPISSKSGSFPTLPLSPTSSKALNGKISTKHSKMILPKPKNTARNWSLSVVATYPLSLPKLRVSTITLRINP